MEQISIVLLCASAYLIGSLPTAYLVVQWRKKQDIRTLGSRNVGALNAFHQIGILWAGLVLLIDAAKGLLAVLVPRWLGMPEWSIYLTTVLVVAGHNWPVFLRFRGGKGVATVLGVSLAIIPQITLIALAATVMLIVLSRNVIIGVGVGIIVVNALAIATSQTAGQTALCLFLSILVTGTYVVGAREQIVTALRTRQFKGLFYGANFNP